MFDLLETIKMKRHKNNSRSQVNTKVNKRKAKLDQDEPSEEPEGVRKSPCIAKASLMLPITCFVIYYVINKTSVKISHTKPLSPEVSGWQRASSEDELKYNTSLCTIEKRNAASLDFEEFEKIYR